MCLAMVLLRCGYRARRTTWLESIEARPDAVAVAGRDRAVSEFGQAGGTGAGRAHN